MAAGKASARDERRSGGHGQAGHRDEAGLEGDEHDGARTGERPDPDQTGDIATEPGQVAGPEPGPRTEATEAPPQDPGGGEGQDPPPPGRQGQGQAHPGHQAGKGDHPAPGDHGGIAPVGHAHARRPPSGSDRLGGRERWADRGGHRGVGGHGPVSVTCPPRRLRPRGAGMCPAGHGPEDLACRVPPAADAGGDAHPAQGGAGHGQSSEAGNLLFDLGHLDQMADLVLGEGPVPTGDDRVQRGPADVEQLGQFAEGRGARARRRRARAGVRRRTCPPRRGPGRRPGEPGAATSGPDRCIR